MLQTVDYLYLLGASQKTQDCQSQIGNPGKKRLALQLFQVRYWNSEISVVNAKKLFTSQIVTCDNYENVAIQV